MVEMPNLANVFISYRRSDAQHASDRIFDRLGFRYGEQRVFKDVDSIPLGANFREVLTDAVDRCDVFLAIISPDWAGRLADPDDFVRIETEHALSRDIPIIPLFVHSATPPTKTDLPESLHGFADQQGLPIRGGPNFNDDIEYLIDGIDHVISAVYGDQAEVPDPEDIQDSFEMIWIEGGYFAISGEREVPERVKVAPFEISKYPITQEQWVAVMGSNPSEFSDCSDCPVEQVSWDAAQRFIERLNQTVDGQFRLPTDTEWEYAARGGKASNEYDFAGSNNPDEVAWHHGNAEGQTHPVGQMQPNELGLHDMSGNVFEWCEDAYGDDPTAHVLRGGSFRFQSDYMRLIDDRIGGLPNSFGIGVGFRIARSLE